MFKFKTLSRTRKEAGGCLLGLTWVLSAYISFQMSHLPRLGQIIPLHFLLICIIWAIFRALTNLSKDSRAIDRGAVACSLALLAVAGSCTCHGCSAAQLSPRCLHSHTHIFFRISTASKFQHQGIFEGGPNLLDNWGFFLPLRRLDYPSLPKLCLWMLLYLCMQFFFLSLSLSPAASQPFCHPGFLSAFSELDSWHALCKHTLQCRRSRGRERCFWQSRMAPPSWAAVSFLNGCDVLMMA